MNQKSTPLYNALELHQQKSPISYHVPGHKYGSIFPGKASDAYKKILEIDATELSGLDDLHSAEGPILEAEELLANLYGSKRSFFLVNGSTSGNLAMVMSGCAEDDIVLVQRNCHKSILNALKLAKAKPVFLEPEYNQEWKVATAITADLVKKALDMYADVKAIILTYPNYYGMTFDLKSIIDMAHSRKVAVLVDEAHGAHFILGEPFPVSAVQMGADIVVHSAHKTLPAMTMGSYLHFNSNLLQIETLMDYLQVFQSSSPSYPIMASLDLARSYLGTYGKQDQDFFLKNIDGFRKGLQAISGIEVLDYPNGIGDPLKITIQTKIGLNGFEIQKILETVGIFTELADSNNVLFVLPLLKEGQVYPFEETVKQIQNALDGFKKINTSKPHQQTGNRISELAVGYKDMKKMKIKDVSFEDAIGKVSGEAIIPYPPGIPLILVGEKITRGMVEQLKDLTENGARFQGGANLSQKRINIFETSK